MAFFEARFSFGDHTKYNNGEVAPGVGRVRYAEPEVDKMFTAWLSAKENGAKRLDDYGTALNNILFHVADLRAALQWYYDQVSHVRKNHSEGDVARNALDRDCGERALKALSAKQPSEQPS